MHLLRVPLHREQPRRIGWGLYGLDELIICPSGGEQARRQVSDRLMVGRVDGQAHCAECNRDTALGLKPNPMASEVPRAVGPMCHGSGPVRREVLIKGPPKRHVEKLDASTDTQHRQLLLLGHRKERQLEQVSVAARRTQVG